MANDKRFVAKNGLQTQNVALVSPNTAAANTITVSMLDSGTLSFSGTSGQLFSVTDSMNGTIFAVNDISGIPSLEITDTGTVRIAETTGNVLVGTSTDNTTDKLQVLGNVSISGNLTVSGTSPGGSQVWILKSANYTAANGDKIIANTTAASFTITLPATPTTGAYVQITDGGNWSVNNLLIDRNGSTIEGIADTLAIDLAQATVEFIYDGTTWQFTA